MMSKPDIPALLAEVRLLISPLPGSHISDLIARVDDALASMGVELCPACEEPIKIGDKCYNDTENGGTFHADCLGSDPESFRDEKGNPLKPGDPIPEPWIYTEEHREMMFPEFKNSLPYKTGLHGADKLAQDRKGDLTINIPTALCWLQFRQDVSTGIDPETRPGVGFTLIGYEPEAEAWPSGVIPRSEAEKLYILLENFLTRNPTVKGKSKPPPTHGD